MKTASMRRTLLSPAALMIFFETLGILISSEITVEESLRLMVSDAESPRDKQPLEELLGELSRVYELGVAMEQTAMFTAYAVNMVRLAERSGYLAETCASLAEHYEQELRQNAQIKSAVISPLIADYNRIYLFKDEVRKAVLRLVCGEVRFHA